MILTRYLSPNVPVMDWKTQGTVYETKVEAQYAGAKLLTAYNIKSVSVNRTKDGRYTLFYSRY